jgi:RsiW-degrading membrane proteinase PrsW (M82 family)
MTSDLASLLKSMLNSRSPLNFAAQYLVDDYAKYHFVMVILGGLTSITLLMLSYMQLRGYSIYRKQAKPRSRMVWAIYLYFGTFTSFLAVALALIVVGNLGNALNPKAGLLHSLPMLSQGNSAGKMNQYQQSIFDWLQSGSTAEPSEVHRVVAERLAWQRPKAIISFALLIATLYLLRRIVRSLRSRMGQLSRLRSSISFLSGFLLSLFATLLIVMTIANTQGSFAPVSLSLFFS